MPSGEPQPDLYSSWVGLVYVFNLIVGTGALTLPASFSKAGWLLSVILLIILALVSFVTVTFIIESIACANATIQWRKIQHHKIDGESEAIVDSGSESEDTNEQTAIVQTSRLRSRYYSLNEKVELGEIAALYFNKWGRISFYLSLCVYLYGDLAIYAAAVAKSLSDIACTSNATSEDFGTPCWEDAPIEKADIYRIFVVFFAILVGPFTYFNVQKTKYLQLCTTTMRWCAFMIMVTLACVRLAKNGAMGHPLMFDFDGVPALIGASVYSFMCHHSLPGLVAPFSEKQYVVRQIGLDYVLICMFYLLLALTGTFAFKELNDLYTLNFLPNNGDYSGIFMKIILYFLSLFPVFTLSTSFPIIAITLQNNLKALFLDVNNMDRYNFVLRKLTFPTIAVLPPIAIAFSTHNLHSLVKFTGAYAGACIQYIIPAALVYLARESCKQEFGSGSNNKYRSAFSGKFWIYLVVCWAVGCVIMVTVNFAL
ncbi:transmembrane protein 104 homolog [Onthophagus taurus]|uniref:transmembrane protein 104 homolog n=1 Tax=Onthophagus taurus TaxID=166361 RepID=UPI000C206E7E|nr:transmembrane protein 104 homolog [Onthophagus taurus]